MIAVLSVLIIVVAAVGLGRAVARGRTAALPAHEAWLLAPLVGALIIAAAVQAVGWVRYDFPAMAGTAAVGLTVALWGLRPDIQAAARPRLPCWVWWLTPAIIVWLISAVAAFAPAIDHDTIRYHLTLPRRDWELGRLTLWFGWSIYEFFPPFAALLTRFAYGLGGAEAAQLLNVAWLALAGGWVWALAVRLGAGPTFAAVAVFLLFIQRVVLNLAPAVTVDIPLLTCVTAAVVLASRLVYFSPRRANGALSSDPRRAGASAPLAAPAMGADAPDGALSSDPRRAGGVTGWLGFVLGAVALTKYHGLLLVPAILAPFAWGAVVGKRSLWPFVNAGLIAATMIAPVLIRNALITENPVFPTFHQHFGPDNLDVFAPFLQAMASRPPVPGGGWALPWTMFVLQDFFDGLQFGYPLFLLLIPFAFLAQVRARLPVLAVCVLFVAAWWALMPHLLRFLMPLFGLAAALSACGLHHVARTAAHLRWFQAIFTAFCIIAVALQSLFVGSSALYRLPAALGLVDLRSVLENPAFRYYGLISPCLWINDRLAPGERYLPLINDPSAFCPQAAVMHALEPGEAAAFYTKTGLPAPSARDLAAKMRRENVRYVLAAVNLGADDERYAFAKHRFDALIEPILDAQTPLLDSPSGDVYDAAPIIAALERAAFEETQQSPKP